MPRILDASSGFFVEKDFKESEEEEIHFNDEDFTFDDLDSDDFNWPQSQNAFITFVKYKTSTPKTKPTTKKLRRLNTPKKNLGKKDSDSRVTRQSSNKLSKANKTSNTDAQNSKENTFDNIKKEKGDVDEYVDIET